MTNNNMQSCTCIVTLQWAVLCKLIVKVVTPFVLKEKFTYTKVSRYL